MFLQLDAKKSPLALLAQTCSNIGADTNSKPVITQIERSKDRNNEKKKNGRDSSSLNNEEVCNSNSVQSNKFSFKPYESSISSKKDRDSSDRSASVDVSDSKKSPSLKVSSPTSHTNNSSTVRVSPTRPSSGGKSSPSNGVSENGSHNSVKSENGKPKSPSNSTSSNSSSTTTNTLTHTTSSLSELARSMESHHNELSLHYAVANASKANGLNYGSCCTTPAAAALGNLKGVDNKSQPYPTFSPYSLASYAAMKGANGSFLIASACPDPYCANCQLSAVAAGRMPQCPSGCTQCNHERIPSSLGAFSPSYPIPGLGHVPAFAGSLYPHSFGGSGAGLMPQSNVCSWTVGGAYCGKRFATSEELLNHLRTHTNPTTGGAEVGAPALLSPLSNLSACHSHYANLVSAAAVSSGGPPSLTTSAGLRRTAYPSLSDVTSLANRYHPYKPPPLPVIGGLPSSSVPQLSGLSPSAAALSMYYSPYGIYAGRIGPPVHP